MNAPVNKVNKSKSFKICVPEETGNIIVAYAGNLLFASIKQQPVLSPTTVKKMRAVADKAYAVITVAIANVINVPKLKPSQLSGLSVTMHPALGIWSFNVNYTLPNGDVQPYKFNVLSTDVSNTFLRTLHGKNVKNADVDKASALLAKI